MLSGGSQRGVGISESAILDRRTAENEDAKKGVFAKAMAEAVMIFPPFFFFFFFGRKRLLIMPY